MDTLTLALGSRGSLTPQGFACSGFRVECVVLADTGTGVGVWGVHFHDRHLVCGEEARQRGRVGAGRLDSDQVDAPEGCEPGEQGVVAAGHGGELVVGDAVSVGVGHDDMVGVGVRVHSGDDHL
nr:hypothetical protein [Rhodococcus sp. B50]